MRLSHILLAAVGILVVTVDGVAGERNNIPAPNIQVESTTVKETNDTMAGNTTAGMTVLPSVDANDAQQGAGRSAVKEERSLRATTKFGWVKDAAKAFKKNPLGFLKFFYLFRKQY
ncbi:hypothetical protein F443_11339 [Phytophthora nicotianae P1569]|uniref:RxLR effector protein n=1 Tax=Phytophthora nicotianae P1569 TaxID=1317065 RepID=V9EY98_PHYNI|nr:hypothetical protein F443_11339 [Phytophthora nicotianae P1569]